MKTCILAGGVLGFIFGIGALGAWIFMLAWNHVLVGIFWTAGPELGFWTAWGLIILINITLSILRLK